MSAGKADSHEKYLPARPSSRGIPAIPAAGLFSHVLFPASEAAVAARPSRGCSTTVPTGTPARVYEAAWVKVRGTKVGEVREKHLRRRLARPSAETPEPLQDVGLREPVRSSRWIRYRADPYRRFTISGFGLTGKFQQGSRSPSGIPCNRKVSMLAC